MKRQSHARGAASGLALAIGAQTLLALGMMVPTLLAFQDASVVRLQTIPADPRDALRGHYLTLNYVFTNTILPEDSDIGSTVYLPLKEGKNGLWEGGAAQLERPASGLYLRGTVKWMSSKRGAVNYGLERFYLAEDAARAEDKRRWTDAKPLVARVEIGRGGKARVLGVERDGLEIR